MTAELFVCPACDGSGQVHSHNPKCWECDGTGRTDRGTAVEIIRRDIMPYVRSICWLSGKPFDEEAELAKALREVMLRDSDDCR